MEKLKDQLKGLNPFKRKSKIALCLAGGGITGAMYEVGCLTALDEFFEEPCCVNQFDIFVGTSAGALIASLIANGYTAREIFNGISEEASSPLNFRRKDIYNLPWSEFFKAFWPFLKRLPALTKHCWKNRKQYSFLDFLSLSQEFLPPGIFSMDNLDRFVAKLLSVEGKSNDFRQLEKELYIPATELDTGERWVFGEEENSDVPISKAVAASSAIPVFFRPFTIKGHDFIDGSTSQVSHVDLAIKHGANLVIIVNPTVPIHNDRTRICLPTFDGQCASLSDKGISYISDQSRRIETSTRFKLGFELFKNEHPDVDFIVIQPQPSDAVLFVHSVMDFDSRKLILNYGYDSTLNKLKQEFMEFQDAFEKHRLKVRPKHFVAHHVTHP